MEAYPQDTAGKKISASFLYSATRGTFEKAGFGYERSQRQEPLRNAQDRPARVPERSANGVP